MTRHTYRIWTVDELAVLRDAMRDGLLVPDVQRRYFPHRTISLPHVGTCDSSAGTGVRVLGEDGTDEKHPYRKLVTVAEHGADTRLTAG